MKLRNFIYTKDSGDSSYRTVIVVSEPRKNYLVYDVTEMSDEDLETLKDVLHKSEEYRENCLADYELITGHKMNDLWRSFKPEGIEWVEEDEL